MVLRNHLVDVQPLAFLVSQPDFDGVELRIDLAILLFQLSQIGALAAHGGNIRIVFATRVPLLENHGLQKVNRIPAGEVFLDNDGLWAFG